MTDKDRGDLLFRKVMERIETFNEATKDVNLTEYASKGRPMDRYGMLLEEAKERYKPGTGPWSKEPGKMDQVDLVYLENMAEAYKVDSSPKGLLAGCIEVLVAEVRKARGWPTPPRIEPSFTYVDMSKDK